MYSGLLLTPLGQETISLYISERCPHCKGPKMIMVFGDSALFIKVSLFRQGVLLRGIPLHVYWLAMYMYEYLLILALYHQLVCMLHVLAHSTYNICL